MAAVSGRERSLRWLLTHGFNVNIVDNYGWTIGHSAARGKHYGCLKLFLEFGGDYNRFVVHDTLGFDLSLEEIAEEPNVVNDILKQYLCDNEDDEGNIKRIFIVLKNFCKKTFLFFTGPEEDGESEEN